MKNMLKRNYLFAVLVLLFGAAGAANAQDFNTGTLVITNDGSVVEISDSLSIRNFSSTLEDYPDSKNAAREAMRAGNNRWLVATNVMDYANLITLNAEAAFAVGRRWTLGAEIRYNPWKFHKGKPDEFYNRKLSTALTARCYLWHVYTGWYISTKVQYQLYNRTNFLNVPKKVKLADGRKEKWTKGFTEEGDAVGMGIGFGYDYMIHPHINLGFGGSLWCGYKIYTLYDCPVCGVIKERGRRGFFNIDNVFVSLQFVF